MKQKYIMPEPITDNSEDSIRNTPTAKEINEMEVNVVIVEDEDTLWREALHANYLEKSRYILSTMTGKRILDYIEEATGVKMPYSDKSKKTLIIRGSEILAKHLETLDNA